MAKGRPTKGIMSETVDNLLVAQIKKYPEVLG